MRKEVIFLVVAAIVAVLFQLGWAEAQPPPIQVNNIVAGCSPDGSVSGDVWVENTSDQTFSVRVTLTLAQHIQGGSADFLPVPGATAVVVSQIAPGKQWKAHYGPLSIIGVDPRADFLQVEVDRTVDQALRAEPSQKFLPCARQTPVATATAITSNANPETPVVRELPQTGYGPPMARVPPFVAWVIIGLALVLAVAGVTVYRRYAR